MDRDNRGIWMPQLKRKPVRPTRLVTSHDPASDKKLRPNRVDYGVSVARAVFGAAPWLGPSIQELLTTFIPNQRIDRIVDCILRLEARLSDVEKDQIQERLLEDEEAVDLLEEGMVQATRAVSESRREHIAALLKSSLTSDELGHIEKSTLWRLLNSVNDMELLILQSHGIRHTEQEAEFRERHDAALAQPLVHTGSTPEEIDRAAVYTSYMQHLVELGLLRPRFARPKRGELPEFDNKTGMVKATGYQISSLGNLILRELGLTTRP